MIADDERDLVWAVQRSLTDDGYHVSCAYNGEEALVVARDKHPDLIILDIIMPRMNGLDVCESIRKDPELASTPILFLTVRNTVQDRVQGLDYGSDDYLSKPFDLRELKARVRALLRRGPATPTDSAEAKSPASLLELYPLALNLHTRQLALDDKVVQLTLAEFQLLHHLMTHPAQVFSSEELLQRVWGYTWGTTDSSLVRWHVKNLRAKMEPDPDHPTYLRTVPHQGYILMAGDPLCTTAGRELDLHHSSHLGIAQATRPETPRSISGG
jgi:DNA-binding response OmpR family regulator